jgi:hypothetical protein
VLQRLQLTFVCRDKAAALVRLTFNKASLVVAQHMLAATHLQLPESG